MARSCRLPYLGLVLAAFITCAPSQTQAQDQTRPLVWDIARSVLIDPTTYTPGVLSYEAQRLDWRTSRVLLDRGWLEHNPRFTVSGRPNDVAIGYDAGIREIRREALARWQQSITHNLAVGIGERVLINRYPAHRKLIRTLSWIERISAASYMSYLASAEHFRQAGRNRQLARGNGYVL